MGDNCAALLQHRDRPGIIRLVRYQKTRPGLAIWPAGSTTAVSESQTQKVVILARGLGTRMRRLDDSAELNDRQAAVAQTGVKALIPVGRPFLDYVLSALLEAGCRRVCLVVGPQHDAIRRYYRDDLKPRRIKIHFAIQEQPKGTADAVLAAESFVGDDPFLLLNSDNYYPAVALRQLGEQTGCAVALFDQQSMLSGSNVSEARLRQFAVGEIGEDGFLVQVLEKPEEEVLASMPRPLWISMNCWRFTPSIFEACRSIRPSVRGELEIPDAVQYAIDVLGERFRAVTVQAPVLDLSSRQDVAPIAARLAGLTVDL